MQRVPSSPSSASTRTRSFTSYIGRLVRSDSHASSLQIALDVLSTVGQATQSVPYLSLVSGLLTQIVKIKGEVDACKDEWDQVVLDVEQIQDLVDRFRAHCVETGRTNLAIPDGLKRPFEALETCIGNVLSALAVFRTRHSSIKDRVMAVLQREKRLRIVQQCRADVARVLNMFNAELQIHQAVRLEEMWSAIMPHAPLLAKLTSPFPDERLPTRPAILCGRMHEIESIIHLIQHKHPAHIAILGPGGIGKTSVALAVVHSSQIVKQFETRRYFVTCEAATSADALVLEVLGVLGMRSEDGVAPQTKLLAFLESVSCILCLDNLETTWDADPHAVEALLARVSATSTTALLVTSRGSTRPLGTDWTKPLLPPLPPLVTDAALEVWESICGISDRHAELLVNAVDCVPLAVTLLAHLAEADSSETLWKLWNKKFTAIIQTHGDSHRLNSVELSIELSLQGPRIVSNPDALRVLSVISLLPLGLKIDNIEDVEKAFHGALPDILAAKLVLMQCSLAYSLDGFLRVLSPIRHYMQRRHYPESALLDHMEHYYVSMTSQPSWKYSLAVRQAIYLEIGNIFEVFQFSLHRSSNLPGLLEAVLLFSDVCTILCAYDTRLLSSAADIAANSAIGFEGQCLERLGSIFYFLNRLGDAEQALQKAITLHVAAANDSALAADLRMLARVRMRQNRMTEAEASLKRSSDLLADDDVGLAQTLWVLGCMQRAQQRNEEAEQTHRRALAISDAWTKPDILLDLGIVLIQLGDLPGAEQCLREAATAHGNIENRLGRGHDMQRLGSVYAKLRRFDEAQAAFDEALDLHTKTGSLRGQAYDHVELARLFLLMNLPLKAENALKQAADLQRQSGEQVAQAKTLFELSDLYSRVNRLSAAEMVLRQSLNLCITNGDESGRTRATSRLQELATRSGQVDSST